MTHRLKGLRTKGELEGLASVNYRGFNRSPSIQNRESKKVQPLYIIERVGGSSLYAVIWRELKGLPLCINMK